MSKAVIRVENISKQYRLGTVSTGTVSHDVNRWWHRVRGKEDPYLKIGETNDRTVKGASEYVWALKDVNFDVNQGEVLGIIGRNGAGKSTLLKILSRTTAPTKGSIKIKGRVASLLEVGTGFHPELSGRENIYLNGAILGMTKSEITRKFDEIVDFAGVERYIDTPVKRYSSGMYVRLAFAVAAHLEPEILIVDEVLAVGDTEFQKKAMGKMKDVSGREGRTVLFVSHSIAAINRMCDNCVVLDNGRITFEGKSDKAIHYYLHGQRNGSACRSWLNLDSAPGNEIVRLKEVKVLARNGSISDTIRIDQEVMITFSYEVLADDIVLTHGFNLYNHTGVHILSSHDKKTMAEQTICKKGTYEASVILPPNFLAEGFHHVGVAMMSYNPYIVHFNEVDAIGFNIVDILNGETARGTYGGSIPGVIRPVLPWETRILNSSI
ncbi:ABC transporter ATP-binding protein [Flavisolibacter sp. BT320]|nr:ABC transporter ATP-binding protein [Flavisolibacter longurius]